MKTILSLIILSTIAGPVRAAEMYRNVDISPMIEHFRKQVVTLDSQVVTYNWSTATGDLDPDAQSQSFNWPWSKKPEPVKIDEAAAAAKSMANRRIMLGRVRTSTDSFWQNYAAPDNENMYGKGLYTAVDPVATQSFGGGGSNWQLLEIILPAGTRLLDLANADTVNTHDTRLSNAAQDIEQMFDCPRSDAADPYFVNGGNKLSHKCASLIYRVFDQALGIQAFAYSYGATQFKDCTSRDYQYNRAFVITRPDVVRSNTVRLFTANTKGYEDDRIRIQTLFAKSLSEQPMYVTDFKNLLLNHLNSFPDRDLDGSTTVCTASTCVITVKFCDAHRTCDTIKLPEMPRPGGSIITAEEFDAKQTLLLWPDLVGKPKTTTISTWLRENKFGCSGNLPYQIK